MTKRKTTLTKKEFEKKNARRLELIEKEFSGFTQEESNRRFDEHPGWEKEHARRCKANLTKAEHKELKQLQKETGQYLREKFPMPFDKLKELEDKLKAAGLKLDE